jgi:PKD repeat protein
MGALWKEAVGICLMVAVLGGAETRGEPAAARQKSPAWLPDHVWTGQVRCRYPGPRARSASAKTQATARSTVISEVEPNDSFATAQQIVISPEPTEPIDLDINATINIGEDVDLYRFTAVKGDIIGVAAIAQVASLDPVLAIQQVNEVSLIENDDHGGLASYYPSNSPFPGGEGLYDAALTWIAPANGDYLIQVRSFQSSSRGDYQLQIRSRRPSFENQNLGATQTIFLDFDGASLNAADTFATDGANTAATLSPLRDFLPSWGLGLEDEAAVEQAIIDQIEEIFDNLRLASLNGDRDTDATPGHFDVQVLNSRDHADPWGESNVSRLILGGTVEQLGIETIGIASTIDPGNFSREDTAVILLDYLSGPATYTDLDGNTVPNPNSVNGAKYASGLTKYDLIGAIVGHIAVHESGHYLGNWHTDNANDVASIMDQGGVPVWIDGGCGDDAILGTADDEVVDFSTDVFTPDEQIALGEERTDVNTAFGLATGKVSREVPPEEPVDEPLQASIRATPTSGSPPLTVSFSAGSIDTSGAEVAYRWDFADGSNTASGSVMTHVFSVPGTYLVKLTATNTLGDSGVASALITVSAVLPTAKATASTLRGTAPLTVSFDASTSTAPGGKIVKYAWDFGDGHSATGVTAQHAYTAAGYYSCKLTVTDDNGATSSATLLITVTSASSSEATNDSSSGSSIPTTSASPQCGSGTGTVLFASLAGLYGLMLMRRKH